MSKPIGEDVREGFYDFLVLHVLPINFRLVRHPSYWRVNELTLYHRYHEYCQRRQMTPMLLTEFRRLMEGFFPDKILQKRGSCGSKDNYWLGIVYCADGVSEANPTVMKLLHLSQPLQWGIGD